MSPGPSTVAESAKALAERARLVTAEVPKDTTQVGDLMPDGDLLDVKGNTTTLAQARDGRPATWPSTAGRGVRTAPDPEGASDATRA